MSKARRMLAVTAGCALVLGSLAVERAQGGAMSHEGHGATHQAQGAAHEAQGDAHQGMSHGQTAAAAAAVPQGVLIRESKVQGATLRYRLYSWEERNVMMKGMEGHQMAGMDTTGKASNHLMLFVDGADGKPLTGGKVGFVVTAPDKSEFKTLTMGMFDGYGADVPLRAKGAYTIRTKAVIGDRTLTEDFVHSVK